MAMIRTGHKPEDWAPIGPARARISNSGGIFGGPIVVARNQHKSVADANFARRDYSKLNKYEAKPPILEPRNGRPWRNEPRCDRFTASKHEPCARRMGHRDSCRSAESIARDHERRRAR